LIAFIKYVIYKNKVTTGIVNTDISVVKKTPLVANSILPSNSVAMITALVATGIAAITTVTPNTIGSKLNGFKIRKTKTGMITNLITVKTYILKESNTSLILIAERETPITIIDRGVVKEPISATGLTMKAGNLILKMKMIIANRDDITPAFKHFFKVIFSVFPPLFADKSMPTVYANKLKGILNIDAKNIAPVPYMDSITGKPMKPTLEKTVINMYEYLSLPLIPNNLGIKKLMITKNAYKHIAHMVIDMIVLLFAVISPDITELRISAGQLTLSIKADIFLFVSKSKMSSFDTM